MVVIKSKAQLNLIIDITRLYVNPQTPAPIIFQDKQNLQHKQVNQEHPKFARDLAIYYTSPLY